MPNNVFAQSKEPVNQPKRNTFDLTFQNNLSMEFGKLYPVFCKEVLPGDSLRIDPSFGLRFMPMNFPVQTKMQANLHFFYVRNRNLWKDWEDFIGRTKTGLTAPYLSTAALTHLAKTGELGDYMGLPTVLAGAYGYNETFEVRDILHTSSSDYNRCYHLENLSDALSWITTNKDTDIRTLLATDDVSTTDYPAVFTEKDCNFLIGDTLQFKYQGSNEYPSSCKWRIIICRKTESGYLPVAIGNHAAVANEELPEDWYDLPIGLEYYINAEGTITQAHADTDVKSALREACQGAPFRVVVATYTNWNDMPSYQQDVSNVAPANIDNPAVYYGIKELVVDGQAAANYTEIDKVPDERNLYKSSDTRISALPFRAYESIYNAFYRNQQNDPYMLSTGPLGAYQAEYNKFIPSQEGGEDSNFYDLRTRNWEQDYLTSAVPSPQQGVAPLVGVSASGQFTFDNGDGTTTTVTPTIGSDGDTLTGIDSYTTTRQTNSDGQPIDLGALDRMKDFILRGISISDFRNVNALQRWLEVNMRRGFRYKDQIMSHYGVDVKYDTLDMPEFIGGMSEPVLVNQINQTVQQVMPGQAGSGKYLDQLGAFAGQASILAQSAHQIDKYCDEHGFIIGILSVSPVPNYSQLLPKMFLKHDTLDYYFPEFGHVGLQPITYREVCPLQSFAANTSNDRLNDVFGYQRAWYDLLGSVDEVHGLMRTELRNFLINRQFDERPVLGHDFISIDPESVNDVFKVTDLNDKIVGQVYFRVSGKRPIPRFGIPRLE